MSIIFVIILSTEEINNYFDDRLDTTNKPNSQIEMNGEHLLPKGIFMIHVTEIK